MRSVLYLCRGIVAEIQERVGEIFILVHMMKFVLLLWYLPSHKEIFPISDIGPVEIDGVILASVTCWKKCPPNCYENLVKPLE